MLDNILASKLYRPGSVAYVSRSGGMSNELNNIISRTTDGVYEGVAIGGDRYEFSRHWFSTWSIELSVIWRGKRRLGVNFSFRKVCEINFYHFPCIAHRYPGSTFMDHVLRYQDTPGVKMIVVLGEVSETI